MSPFSMHASTTVTVLKVLRAAALPDVKSVRMKSSIFLFTIKTKAAANSLDLVELVSILVVTRTIASWPCVVWSRRCGAMACFSISQFSITMSNGECSLKKARHALSKPFAKLGPVLPIDEIG